MPSSLRTTGKPTSSCCSFLQETASALPAVRFLTLHLKVCAGADTQFCDGSDLT